VIASRIARPTRDLAAATEFYRDNLGLATTGGFRGHDGYDGTFFALPGGGELELTAGPTPPAGWSDEDLLVLYVADRTELLRWSDDLQAHGIAPVTAANPYWNRMGVTVLDPDGHRVVIALRDRAIGSSVEIEWHDGDRAELRPMFQLAEDSPEQLARYLHVGRVLVARRSGKLVGHLQLVSTDQPDEIELKSMAVTPEQQGTGVGRALVEKAVAYANGVGYRRMLVSTAAADTGNLRFYQRVGFRMHSVEHDAFTPATGYPKQILIDGIAIRDRVWFTRALQADPN
jgi:GNAT superfamily N-acetyltransferase